MRGTISISRTRILTPSQGEGAAPRARRVPTARPSTGALSTRRASPKDIPWIESWAASLGLPAVVGAGALTFVLLEDGQRVGYLAARDQMVDTPLGSEPVRWIVSAFLVPRARGRGLLMRFGALLSQQHHRQGKLGARVSTANTRMLKLMRVGGWTKIRSSRQWVDFVLDLNAPFGAATSRRGG